MKVVKSVSELQKITREIKDSGKRIGFVPTMGYLHDGHISLMIKARSENDVLIASVYVNPTQFAPNEDLDTYPRNEAADIEKMKAIGVDYAFFPSDEMMYPDGYMTYVEPTGKLLTVLCAKSRPTHFKGVDTIVLKLFNITKADRAYFGMKDAQQVAVIKSMVRDLNLDIDIVPCPIIREADGLALSSRNKYLSEELRKDALILNKSLEHAKSLIKSGEFRAGVIKEQIIRDISAVKSAEIDYVEIIDFEHFDVVDSIVDHTLIAVAVRFGRTRLIDNFLYLEN